MTVAVNDRVIGPYVCTGGETLLPFDFPCDPAELGVVRLRASVEATLAYATDFTVSGANAVLAVPALAGDQYAVFGDRDMARSTNFISWQALPPAQVEREFDNVYHLLQELKRDANLTLRRTKLGATYDAGGGRLTGLTPGVANTDAATIAQLIGASPVVLPPVTPVADVETYADMMALTTADTAPGRIISLRAGAAYGGYGNTDYVVLAGGNAVNGLVADGVVVMQNTAGDLTFARRRFYDEGVIELMWFAPALDGVSDSAAQLTAFFNALDAHQSTRGKITGWIAKTGKPFLTSVEQKISSNTTLTGGGELRAHASMPQSVSLLRVKALSLATGLYAQSNIVLDDIVFDGGNRTFNTLTARQALLRMFSIVDFTIRNCTLRNHQSTLLAICGNLRVRETGNKYSAWGLPGDPKDIAGVANNGGGLVRLTLATTAGMTTGESWYTLGLEGFTAINDTGHIITVVDATHVDLQGSVYAAGYTTGGSIAPYVDRGSAITCIANPIDETPHSTLLSDQSIFTGGWWNAIQCFSDYYELTGHHINGTMESGIFIRDQNAAAPGNFTRVGIVKGNIIENVGRALLDGAGIVFGGVRGLIEGNIVRNCVNIGISIVSEALDLSVLGNKLFSCNNDPVYFGSGGHIIFRDASTTRSPARVHIAHNTCRDENATIKAKYGIAVFNVGTANVLDDILIEGNDVARSAVLAGDRIYIQPASFGARVFVRHNPGAPRTSQTEGLIACNGSAIAHTGTTAETVLATITLPGAVMKANSRLEITTLWGCTNNANIKQPRVRLGGAAGTVFMGQNLTTVDSLRITTEIANRNSRTAQIGGPAGGSVSGTGFGPAATALVTAAVNTLADFDIVLTGQLAAAGDTLTLHAYSVKLFDIE